MNPFIEGMVAFRQAKLVTMNPYSIGSMNYSHWRAGWYEAGELNLLMRTKQLTSGKKSID